MIPRAAPGATRAFMLAALRLLLAFALLFYGLDALTAARTARVDLAMAWETRIPDWSPAWPVYLSVLLTPLLPWACGLPATEIRAWERRMALAIAIAALGFVLLPADPPLRAEAAPPDLLARWGRAVAGQHNLLPSLHVALGGLSMAWVWANAGPRLRALLVLWAVALLASVLLTRQHHVADVLAGAALAWVLRPRRAAA
jgi:PAP2 superfamily